jgi:hypothetical protein
MTGTTDRSVENESGVSNTLDGGLPPESDYPILESEADLGAGENHAFRFSDDKGRYSLLKTTTFRAADRSPQEA